MRILTRKKITLGGHVKEVERMKAQNNTKKFSNNKREKDSTVGLKKTLDNFVEEIKA
ncbi:MAG: hypothetical protein WC635_02800 [Bacteriovorax sp.]